MSDNKENSLAVMPVRRTDGTHALRLCLDQGLLTPDMTRRVVGIMDSCPGVTLRATTGQRMNLENVPEDRLDEVVALLGTAIPKCPPGVSVCSGGDLCKLGMQPTRSMADRLLAVIRENGPYPFKVKSGVSGCGMACGLSFVRDVGLVAGAKGWDVYFGGCATSKACPGVRIGKGLSADKALEVVGRALVLYRENGKKRERTSGLMRRLGKEALLSALA